MSIHVNISVTRTEPPPNGRFRLRIPGPALVIALVLSVLLTAGGVALARIPDAKTGVFHGCVSSAGALRLIDPSNGGTCKASEHAVSWSQKGVNWKGDWDSTIAYGVNDAVSLNGSSYIATVKNTDQSPDTSDDWGILSAAGLNGNTVLHGIGAPADTTGNKGDFYIDTQATMLYGPKYRKCVVIGLEKTCSDVWPTTGTALVGPKGDTGDQGPPGDPGTPGAAGPSHVYTSSNYDGVSLHNFTQTMVTSLALPAGDYYVLAKLEGENYDHSPQNFECSLYVNYDNSLTGEIDSEGFYALGSTDNNTHQYPLHIGLQGSVYYVSPGYANIGCNTYNGDAGSVQLAAIQVGGIN